MSDELRDVLNPNHPVTQAMDRQYHKLLALLLWRDHAVAGERTVVTDEQVRRFAERRSGYSLVVHERGDRLELKLVPRDEAERLARKAGGLSV
jgi:hypothetical protein